MWEYNSKESSWSEYFENTIPQNCLKRNVLRIQFRRIALKRKCCENSLKGECGNTTPESCLKWNVLRIQFCRIASKRSVGIQLKKVASKGSVGYNSAELPQRKCFENIILQNYLKGKCGNTTLQSCLKENILRIQLCKIASKEMFWENTTP